MLIVEIVSNNENGVAFKSKYGTLLVPPKEMQPEAIRVFKVGLLMAVEDNYWPKLEKVSLSYV